MGGTTLSEPDRPTGPPAVEAIADPDPEPAEPAPPDEPALPDEPPAPPGPRPVRPALPVLLAALLAAALGQTAALPALPAIAAELPGGPPVSWVATAYLVASALGLPLNGALGDRIGRKAGLLLALLVFTAGAGLAGTTHSPTALVAFRAVQGLGAGGLLAGVHALLTEAAPSRVRGRRTAAAGATYAAGLLAGPLVGGYCVDHGAWRWCLTLDVPLGLLVLFAAAATLRLPRPAARPRPDLAGALLLAAFATCLALPAGWGGGRYAWDSAMILGSAAGAPVTAALFVFVEHRAAAPLIPPRLLREVLFGRTGLVGAALALALYGAVRHLPAFLQAAGGSTATASGLLMLPLAGALALAALATGGLIHRTGHVTVFPILGCVVAAQGMWLLCHLRPDTARPVFALWTGILGLGLGLVLPVLVLAVRASVPAPDPAGAIVCLRRLAGSVGTALAGVLLAGHLAARLPDPGPLAPQVVAALPAALRHAPAAYAQAVPGSYLFLAPVLVLGSLLALFRKENPLVSDAPQAPHPPYGDQAAPATVPPARSTPGPAVNAIAAPESCPTETVPCAAPAAAAPGVPVCGTVRHHDGSVVPRTALTLIDAAGRQVGRGATGEDGRYALSTPGVGAYVLIAATGGHQPQAVTVTVGERPVELDVVLGGVGRLVGTVTTAEGAPVRDATVTLTDVRGEVVATARSGREGGYAMGELVAGEYTLAGSAPAFRPVALPVAVQASRETWQDVELAGGAVLRGTVRAGDGHRVEDARVTLLDAGGNVVDTATTGTDGLFRFVDLSAGEYTVIAAGYPPVATVLRLTGGGRTERDLQLGYED
ncbi:MFS transporter [Streptomyces yunnanensis]|uniref:alpha-amylase n=1 Tax=Streptomyces yunnanensis TaxID=156453 RepID=A0A9X8QSM1_9ACTN|nr:MFS transporter [Streptomyces yunnanensis]SHL79445.1 Carboxypeptidase regulatory-like domain-containing protein [Streptomyces yunnanensis]